jgi:hypothetical protein
MLAHTVLNPLFSSLYEPFALRSGRAYSRFFSEGNSPEQGKERRSARWSEVGDFFSALGLEVETELSVSRPGGGWSRLRAAEQLAAKTTLAEAVSCEAQRMGPSPLAAHYRAFQLQPLLKRYYTKADKEGRAIRKRALTKKPGFQEEPFSAAR